MQIKNILHKDLRNLFVRGDPKGVPANSLNKLVNMLGFLQDMGSLEELQSPPMWKVHKLKGDQKGTWSLSVTRNWRLTFRYDPKENQIYDLDLSDYH